MAPFPLRNQWSHYLPVHSFLSVVSQIKFVPIREVTSSDTYVLMHRNKEQLCVIVLSYLKCNRFVIYGVERKRYMRCWYTCAKDAGGLSPSLCVLSRYLLRRRTNGHLHVVPLTRLPTQVIDHLHEANAARRRSPSPARSGIPRTAAFRRGRWRLRNGRRSASALPQWHADS